MPGPRFSFLSRDAFRRIVRFALRSCYDALVARIARRRSRCKGGGLFYGVYLGGIK